MEDKENIRFLKKSDLLEVAKKINATKDWQLSDYAWNKSQWKMIMKFVEKVRKEIEKGCRGIPANCYEIKKEINKHLGEIK